MLNLIQHLTKSKTYETLKQVQGDKLGLFTRQTTIQIHKKPSLDFSQYKKLLLSKHDIFWSNPDKFVYFIY